MNDTLADDYSGLDTMECDYCGREVEVLIDNGCIVGGGVVIGWGSFECDECAQEWAGFGSRREMNENTPK